MAIAEEHGARVLSHPFANYATQFNWALENVPRRCNVGSCASSADETDQRAPAGGVFCRCYQDSCAGCCDWRSSLPGASAFWGASCALGTRIRFGSFGCGGVAKASVKIRGWTSILCCGREGCQRVQGELIHDIPKDLTDWTAKHNWYASQECRRIITGKDDVASARLDGQAGDRSAGSSKTPTLRLPLFYRAFLYWFYRYFVRFGFLDGTQGLVYHFLQGFWYPLFG